jgi:CheY-like chemotaxis protein
MVAIPTRISWRHTYIGIADANAEWRRTLRAMCNTLGAVEVIDAGDGATFMQAATNFGKGLDLLLVDDGMTPMTGLLMVRHIRATANHPSRRAAAILMPASADTDTLRQALSCGFHGVIPKPFSAQVMGDRAERILSQPMLWQETDGVLLPLMPKQS